MRRSDRLEVEGVQGESFELLVKFYHFFLPAEVFEFYFLRHLFREERNSITCLELLLLNVGEGLDDESLSVFLGVFVVETVDERIERRTDFFAEFNSFFNCFTRSGIVLLVEVKIRVHEELHNLEEVDIVVASMFDQFVIFDSDVDVRKGLLVAVVEVAQFHPLVHQSQGHLLLFLLVLLYLVVVVYPSGLIHILPSALPEGLNEIDD